MKLFPVVVFRSGPVALRPVALAGGRLPARIAELQRLSPILNTHCAAGPNGWLEVEKLPAAAIEKLNANQLVLAQSQLLMLSRLRAVLDGQRPSFLPTASLLHSVAGRQLSGGMVRTDTSGSSSTFGEVSVDPGTQASLVCGTLLYEVQQYAAQAEQDRVGVESDIQQANNLLQMAQGDHDPNQKLALAAKGLALLQDAAQLIQDAENAAAAAAAALAQVKAGIAGVSCGTSTVDSTQQAAGAAEVAAQALDDPAYVAALGSLRAALQNVRDAAQAQIAVVPPPPVECIHFQGNWYGGLDVTFDEPCTKQLIAYLDHNADMSALGGVITGLIAAATPIGPVAALICIIVAAVLASLALDMKLVEQDTTVADVNGMGVTWHFSGFPLQFGGAFELNTLLAELANPGFGNQWVSVLWITGNG